MSNVSDILSTYSVSNAKSSTNTTSSASSSTSLDMSDYLKLMVAQLTNQDSTNPMDTSEMVAQLAQMATVEAMNSFQTMSNNTYGASLMGKEVTVMDTDNNGKYKGYVTGTVSAVTLYNGSTQLVVDGKSFELSQLVMIGKPDDTASTQSETAEETAEATAPGDQNAKATAAANSASTPVTGASSMATTSTPSVKAEAAVNTAAPTGQTVIYEDKEDYYEAAEKDVMS